jgi:putative oxidoreductase
MTIDRATLESLTPKALAVLRIVTGFLFVQHGTAKLLGIPHFDMFNDLQVFSLIGFAGILEIVGSVLVILGLWTRPAAFVLSGEMAVAYFMAHAAQGHVLSPTLNQGESAVLFCFIFLFLSAAGAGAWSIDNRARQP